MIPVEASHWLEETLVGSPLERRALTERVERFYSEKSFETSGINPTDFVDAIMKAASM